MVLSALATGAFSTILSVRILSAPVLGESVIKQTDIAQQQYVTGGQINTHDDFLLLFTGFYGQVTLFCRKLNNVVIYAFWC